VAKRDLKPGEMLDGEGGYTVWGKLLPAKRSLAMKALPIGLAHGVKLVRPIPAGQAITFDDIEPAPDSPALQLRHEAQAMI
jgi:predicted homoserine dehydrogenase-like protein